MPYASPQFGFSFMLTPLVKRLIIANVAIFLVSLLVGERFMIDWFAFQPTRIIVRPWGPITYMFVHGGLMHLAVNMLVLFFFGPPLENKWGEREFLKFYAICGLGGVALSYLFLPANVIGASAAVYGVMLAFAMNWPDAPIYVWGIFPVKAKYLMTFLFVVAVLSAAQGSGGGIAHFAHLGGLFAGFAYLKSDWRPGHHLSRLKKAAARRRLAIVSGERDEEKRERAARPVGDSARRHRNDAELYDAVDAVLDKISAHGISSLSSEELRVLDEVSKRHRTN